MYCQLFINKYILCTIIFDISRQMPEAVDMALM